MKRMVAPCYSVVRVGFLLAALLGLGLIAAGAAPPDRTRDQPPGRSGGKQGERKSGADSPNSFSRTVAEDAGSPEAPLLFCIGVHIEPFGAAVSELAGSRKSPDAPADKSGKDGGRGGQDFNDPAFFRRHVDYLRSLAAVMAKHRGKMTVQAQTPFTRAAAESKNTLLADLAAQGHEMALHFHEDAHLGRRCEKLPAAVWTDVMREEIGWIRKAVGREIAVRYWSGGNNYPGVLEAAAGAGLQVMSDHKNPRRQETVDALLAIHPWRPAGGPSEDDMSAFARHDPKGKIIYLPDGIFASADFHARKQDGDGAYLDFLTDGLERSLRAARRDRVNVFHITAHSGEFRGRPDTPPFEILDQWLTRVVDPLVKSGKVRWATFADMADAYAAWEKQDGAATDARAAAAAGQTAAAPATSVVASAAAPQAYMTFAVNVHDYVRCSDSADTILRLVGIFKKHRVRGDFYFTAPVAEAYAQERPDAVRVLKESGMTISYHLRPPHPVYIGFDRRLKELDDAALARTLREYETFRLDMVTGGIQKDRPGGYRFVADLFGRNPVCVSPQTNDRRIKTAVDAVYREMGARMVIRYHESGASVEQPFEFMDGLLVRPSDFSITRWTLPGESEDAFWWNRVASPRAAGQFNPVSRLKQQLADWKAPRPPFVTSLIHENNFYRRGAEAWALRYSTDTQTRTPREPPYKMDAPDESRPRSAQEQDAIWRAYEELVAYAAAHLGVVTSEDIVKLAAAAGAAPAP